jgi:hypothetical protein
MSFFKNLLKQASRTIVRGTVGAITSGVTGALSRSAGSFAKGATNKVTGEIGNGIKSAVNRYKLSQLKEVSVTAKRYGS